MIAKTLQALEPVLAQELEALGATDIEQGRRMGLLHWGQERCSIVRTIVCARPCVSSCLSPPSAPMTPIELYRQLKRLDSERVDAGW